MSDPNIDELRAELAREELEAAGVDVGAMTRAQLVEHYDRVIGPRESAALQRSFAHAFGGKAGA